MELPRSPSCPLFPHDVAIVGRASSLHPSVLVRHNLQGGSKSALAEPTDASTVSASSNDSPAETSSECDSSPESATTPPQSPEVPKVIPACPREAIAHVVSSQERCFSASPRPASSPRRSALRPQSPTVFCAVATPRVQPSPRRTVRFAPQLTPRAQPSPRRMVSAPADGFSGAASPELSPRSCNPVVVNSMTASRHAPYIGGTHAPMIADSRKWARQVTTDMPTTNAFSTTCMGSSNDFATCASNAYETGSNITVKARPALDKDRFTMSPTKPGVTAALRHAGTAGKRWLACQRDLGFSGQQCQQTSRALGAGTGKVAIPSRTSEPYSHAFRTPRSVPSDGVVPGTPAKLGVSEALRQAELARSRVSDLLDRRQRTPVPSSRVPSPRAACSSPRVSPRWAQLPAHASLADSDRSHISGEGPVEDADASTQAPDAVNGAGDLEQGILASAASVSSSCSTFFAMSASAAPTVAVNKIGAESVVNSSTNDDSRALEMLAAAGAASTRFSSQRTTTSSGNREVANPGDVTFRGKTGMPAVLTLEEATARALSTFETWRALELVTVRTATAGGVESRGPKRLISAPVGDCQFRRALARSASECA